MLSRFSDLTNQLATAENVSFAIADVKTYLNLVNKLQRLPRFINLDKGIKKAKTLVFKSNLEKILDTMLGKDEFISNLIDKFRPLKEKLRFGFLSGALELTFSTMLLYFSY